MTSSKATQKSGADAGVDGGDVLDTLVKQFTDPMACLRELIQNAVDAGSDVVEVRAFREGEHNVLEIQDHGEGMDKAVIETRLVRLFASNKDGDLTKIGKFGIGFVSVFALKPDAVCVDTARAGERWRVVFHPDRSWTRAALSEAMEGTRVRLFIKGSAADLEKLRRDADVAVRRWCRYLEAEILMEGKPINESLSLPGCPIVANHDDGEGTAIIVGVGGPVSVGFYNKGLTLLETTSWDDLPDGVSIRLSSRWLEHTLTRDSVVRDDHYKKAIAMAKRLVSDALLPSCFAALEGGTDARARSPVLRWLAEHMEDATGNKLITKQAFLKSVDGRVHSPRSLKGKRVGVVVDATPGARRVGIAAAQRHPVFPISDLYADGDQAAIARFLGAYVLDVIDVEDHFVAAEVVGSHGDDGAARQARAERLAERTNELLKVIGDAPTVIMADIVGRQARSCASWKAPGSWALKSNEAMPIAVVPEKARGRAVVVVDAEHHDIKPILRLAATETTLAAMLLARLVLPIPLPAKDNLALSDVAWKRRDGGRSGRGAA
jgi:hypothetical protein